MIRVKRNISSILRGALIVVAILHTATSCSVVAFPEKASFSFTPVYGTLTMDGSAKMESGSVTSGKTRNGPNDLENALNVADRDTGVGATLGYGDGFAGVEFGFLRYEQRAFDTTGRLENDFGSLLKDDAVSSDILFQQWTLEYLVRLVDLELSDKVDFAFAAGVGVHHNSLRFQAETPLASTPSSVSLSMQDGGMPMLRSRADVTWKRLRGRIDFGYSDGHWRNIDGRVADFEVSAAYSVTRDVRAFASWRRYDLPFAGGKNGLDYEFDAQLEGFYFGLELRF